MTEFELIRRPALPAGEPKVLGGLALEAVTDGVILQLLARPGAVAEVGILAAIGQTEGLSLRNSGPGQWLLVADGAVDVDVIADRLATVAYLVDQTHGRSRIRIRGPQVRQLLAKGTGVDLHDNQFPINHAVMTLIGHIGANLARTSEDCYELLVLRGFADSLWHELEIMAAEFT
ncbi:sarcosine oxidase subunit gamma [Rhizobium sp. LEGMi198b]